jgi:sugar phosphate isomerase/epimerase
MQIGAMNHPQAAVADEIRWMAAMGLDFIDLTLEPPAAAIDRVDAAEVRALLADHGMGVVGHTAYYLPLAHPFESVRRGAVEALKQSADAFSRVGARWMNIHPDRHAPMHDRAFYIAKNIESMQEVALACGDCGVGLMIENLPGDYNSPEQLADLLEPLPDLGLHLDIGHANLRVWGNQTEPILDRYAGRLKHVHLHDNKGGDADLHLPLGTGTMDWRRHVESLKRSGYDGTITLEVFTPDRRHFEYSRDVLRAAWDAL